MKSYHHSSILPTCVIGALFLLAVSTPAATYYWDGNDDTAGFGMAGGIWADPTLGLLTSGWSLDGTGATAVDGTSITTTTSDLINFGNGATGLGAGTITVSGTVNSGGMTFASGSGAITLSGGTINFAAASTITVNNTENTISSQISGAGLTKAGTGKLTLSGANSYTGTTTISAGTLALTGGDNRLATAGTVNFSNNATLSIANNQTLSTVTVTNSLTTSQTFTGTINGGGGLTLTGSSFSIGATAAGTSGSTVAQILNMSGLGSFFYNNSGGTFSVGGTPTGGNGVANGTVTLPGEATITASSLGVGSNPHPSNGGRNTGTLTLGKTTTINANTIQVGGTRADGTIQYGTVTAPMLTLRGSDGISAVTTMTLGTGITTGGNPYSGTVNLTTNVTGSTSAALDAKITTLNIGYVTATSSQNASYNGTLQMGNGTLDADTIYLGRNVAGGGGGTGAGNGTLTVSGGTVKARNLYLGDQNNITATNTVSGTFNLNGGANLHAQTIAKGPGTGTQAATRTFNWNEGTIHNYDSSTDLTIGSFGGTATFALIGAGAHTFEISSGRQGTVHQVISGSGSSGLTKAGAGTLTLSGTNTYSGPTNIDVGTLVVSSSGSINTTSAINVAAGASFVYNSSTALTVAPTLNSSAGNKATFSGSGTLNAAMTLNSLDQVLAPGNSPGIQAFGANQAWESFTYDWELNDWVDKVAGTNIDQIQITGSLTLSGVYALNILSLDALNVAGLVGANGANDGNLFTETNNSWTILTTTGGIIGFNASAWSLNTSGFADSFEGAWSLASTGNDLVLSYTVIPEPGAALLGGFGILALLRRRR